VQGWLRQQRAASDQAAARPDASAAGRRAGTGYVADRIARVRAHVAGMIAAAPRALDELSRIAALVAPELRNRGIGAIVLLCAAFLGLGVAAEWLYWWLTRGARRHIIAHAVDTPAERVRAAGLRLAFGLGWVAAFTLGSIGAFLIFRWPPLLREIVLTYLQVFLVVRLAIVMGRFLIAPGAPRFRIVPMADRAARYWSRWLTILVGWFAFSRLTGGLLTTLGLPDDVLGLYIAIVAAVWLALGLAALWGRPPRYDTPTADALVLSWVFTAVFATLWFMLLAGALTAFWLGLMIVLLPLALRLVREGVAGLLRADAAHPPAAAAGSLVEVCLERGLRAALIIGAIYFVAGLWEIDLASLAARETLATWLLAGALNAVIILLMADLLWHVSRVLIDGRVAAAGRAEAEIGSEEARRRARIRTLLPIVRNLLAVLIAAMAAMMALSQLGVEIGPLIAGAGVVGVAIGFGAQTLVKDIISGMFYLLDDAFRVGEYIQSGSYKGTVESFSLRSIKLRHHRGPLYTVPFGELGAVQNMSRDWVIDKLTISVTYDSDLDKAKKLIKQIGRELAEDPEFKPHILEPLKMQGVETFGDYAVNLRLKMMTRPGEQFVIRRRAYAAIKKAFDANGIRFAFPTVQIAGGGADQVPAAAAARALVGREPGQQPA
jgi:moderate conductance mechanosensitive channel